MGPTGGCYTEMACNQLLRPRSRSLYISLETVRVVLKIATFLVICHCSKEIWPPQSIFGPSVCLFFAPSEWFLAGFGPLRVVFGPLEWFWPSEWFLAPQSVFWPPQSGFWPPQSGFWPPQSRVVFGPLRVVWPPQSGF